MPEEPIAALREAVQQRPNDAAERMKLGMACERAGRVEEAARHYALAAALGPALPAAQIRLGRCLHALGLAAPATAALRAAVAAAPDALEPRWELAQSLATQGQAEAAAALLHETLAMAPGDAETKLRLAQTLHQLGDFAAAEPLFAAAARQGDRRGTAWHGVVSGRRFAPADRPLLAEMATLAEAPGLPPEQRIALLFARGKAHDDLGEYAAAAACFAAGNAEQRAILPRFDRAGHRATIDRLIATCTPALFAARRDWGSASERPVLIVGLMRSGTTLLEQRLAGHPDIAAGGERLFWSRSGPLPAADREATARIAAAYAAELAGVSPAARRVTDKLPHNVYALGAIHLAFPRARVLHCRRRLADVALSIYRTLFWSRYEFAYDLGDIAFLCREYERLAAHWRAVLPAGTMLEVEYEALVAAPERELRDIIRFCGLDWDDTCLRPAERGRQIRSASAWQARQPIHTGSVERWRNYADYFPELAALAGG